MTEKSEPGDQQISELFAMIKSDNPSQATDKAILARAQQGLPTNQSEDKIASIKPGGWRKWQWPGSIAASVCLISLLFYHQFSRFETVQGRDAALPDFSQIDPVSQARSNLEIESKTRAQRETTPMASTTEDEFMLAEKPDLSNFAEQEIEAMEISNFSPVVINPLVAQLEQDLTPEQDPVNQVEPIAPKDIESQSRQLVSMALDTNYLNNLLTRLDLIEQTELIEATGARRQRSEVLLNQARQQQEKQQREKAVAAAQRKKSLLTKQPDMPDPQQELFSYLYNYALYNPNQPIPDKYLQALTAENRDKLEQLSEPEQP